MDSAADLPFPPDEPDRVLATRRSCLVAAAFASEAGDALAGTRTRLGAAWKGTAASACSTELCHAEHLVARTVRPLAEAAGVLASYHAALVEARREVGQLRAAYDDDVSRARHAVVLLAVDPTLDPHLRRLAEVERADALRRDLGAHQRRYAEVLDELARAAAATGRRLTALAVTVLPVPAARGGPSSSETVLAAALPLLAAQRALVGAGMSVPPRGTPVSMIRSWWALLSRDERDRLVRAHPAALGSLAGLSAVTRSRANERLLARALRSTEGSGPTAEARHALAVRAALRRARARVDPATGVPAVVLLLAFEPQAYEGDGRAVIAVGDPDSADHVAFLVPGMGSTVARTAPRLVAAASTVTAAAALRAPTRPTAAVAWVGYDAPGAEAVLSSEPARRGGDRLAADVRALQATRAVPAHVTVVGHSYGSTTVGSALRDHRLGAHEVVLLGSPGAAVTAAGDLRVPAGHVYVGASSRDPVSYLDFFGTDPTHRRFGGVRFEAESITRNAYRLDADDHASYYAEGSESVRNLAAVVVGDHDAVRVAPYREELPFLPDGINTDPEADREPTGARP